MAKVKVKKKKSTSVGKKKYSAKGLSKAVRSLSKGRASSEYMKYGDIKKVSDVDTRTSVSSGRRTYSRDSFGAGGWANRLYTTGGKPAGTKFRHGGKTYKVVPVNRFSATAEEVKV